MIGLNRALIDYVRRQTLAGERDTRRIARGLRVQAEQAVASSSTGSASLMASS